MTKKEKNDYPKFRKRIEQIRIERKLSRAEFIKLIGVSDKGYRNWINGMNSDNNDGNLVYPMPSVPVLIHIAKVLGVSTDYLLGESDYTSVSNAFIGSETGLSDNAIASLRGLCVSDQNALDNRQPSLCVIPVLNQMLSAGNGIEIEMFLHAFRNYLHTDYSVPVYHDGTASVQCINGENTLAPTCIVPDNEMDKDKNGVYVQHLARDVRNPQDNVALTLSREFLQAVALKQVEQSLIELADTISET